MRSDLGQLLSDGGQIVGGGAALVGVTAFTIASFARDLGADVDPIKWAAVGTQFGGLLGVGALLGRL